MEHTTVTLNDENEGEILLFSDDRQAGKMVIAVSEKTLTVYHTEVDEAYRDRGFAKLLLDRLVGYARENNLKIIPLCPYVNVQFRRHPEQFADIWQRE